MTSQRQVEFRREYRSRIIGWYDGYFHIAITYAMGAAAFYIYVEHIRNVTLMEWLTMRPGFSGRCALFLLAAALGGCASHSTEPSPEFQRAAWEGRNIYPQGLQVGDPGVHAQLFQ